MMKSKGEIIISAFGRIPWVKKAEARRRFNRVEKKFISESRILEGESDPILRKQIVDEYVSRHGRFVKNELATIDRLLDQAPVFEGIDSAEQKEAIRCKLIFNWIGLGLHPEEMICYELTESSLEEKKSFMSAGDNMRMILKMNDLRDSRIFNNKALTYKRFKKYYHRDAVYITKKSDYPAFASFAKKHPVFVKKQVFESMGRSVELVDAAKKDSKKLFSSLIAKGPHLLEEKVNQSAEMASLNSSSVNTVRCIAFYTRDGIEDLYYFMKVGRKGSFVDNGGAGGILVGIDRETGQLNTDGFDEFDRRYPVHPDSGIPFKGFQLPEWNNMKAVCREMSASIPSVKFIGWDLAHSTDGWVVIEGNARSQLIGPQTVWKVGIKKELETIMKNMDLIL